MPRLAANLDTLFTEWDAADRFAVAAKAGFKGVELSSPYDFGPGRLGDLLAMNGLELTVFDAPAGNPDAGDRGLAAQPGREGEFLDGLERAFELADFVEAKRIHVLAGVMPEDADFDSYYETYVSNLGKAAREARSRGLLVMIQPISSTVIPDTFLTTPDQALAVIEDVDEPALCLMFDVFHAQMTQGRLTETLEGALDRIAHVRAAGVPEGAEPDTGEVSYPFLFDRLDADGYDGWVGLDYRPRLGTLPGLRWARAWGIDAGGISAPKPAKNLDDSGKGL